MKKVKVYFPVLPEICIRDSYNGSKTAHTYQNIYQYDGAGFGDALFTAGTSPVVGVNKFTARDNEKLTACGVYVPAANCSVKVRVYQDQMCIRDSLAGQRAGTFSEACRDHRTG